MQLRLLGPIELEGASDKGLGGPKERAVLAYLAMQRGAAVPASALVDALWPEGPPRTALRTVQAYVSRLRKALAGLEGWDLESGPGGWTVRFPPGGLDVAEVERLMATGRDAAREGDDLGAAFAFAEALACWRGTPLAELEALPWARGEQARLVELRLELLEERIDAELACGRSGALVAELDALCQAHPLRERLWAQRMTALYRAGRQADALRAASELRRTLRDELGIDPTPAIVRLEQQILNQDPSLEAAFVAPPTAAVPAASAVRPLPVALERLRLGEFVGRAGELKTLAAAWDAARAGAVQLVLVAGEPGIGKTTLAVEQAVTAAGEGATVLFGRCDEESLAPFQPIVEALSHYVAFTDPDVLRSQLGSRLADLALLVPEVGRRLPEMADVVPSGAETERYRIFEAVPALLGAASDEAPVVLLLDDLHWADQPTLQLLQHLLRRAGPQGLLIVGTYRDTDLTRTHPLAHALGDLRRTTSVTRVALRGLRHADVVDLVAGQSGGDGDLALARSLWDGSEGHPLFLREILRHLAETGAIATVDGTGWRAVRRIDQLGIPEGVREVIGRRLSHLSDAANTALRAGSVLGRELRIDVLERVADLTADEILDACEEATAAGVLDEVPGAPGRYTFTHALLRQALYGELSLTRRVRLHQRVGEAVEHLHRGQPDGSHTAELAHHFSQAAVAGQADKAIDYARRAAAHARSMAAYEEAVRHLTVALEVIDETGTDTAARVDLLLEIGELHWHAGDAVAARRTFEAALALVGDADPDRFAAGALGYAGGNQRTVWVDMALRNDRNIELLREADRRLGDGDSIARAHVLACLARELNRARGTADERATLVVQAQAMARRVGDPLTLAHVLLDACLARYSAHTAEVRADMAAEAGSIAVGLGDLHLEGHAALHRFHALAEAGRFEEGRDHLDRARELLTSLRDPAAEYLLPSYDAGFLSMQGRLTEAADLAARGFQRAHDRGDPNALIVLGGGLLGQCLYSGESGRLIDLLSQVEDLYPTIEGCARTIEGLLLAEHGYTAESQAVLDQVDPADPSSLPEDPFWSFSCHCLARAYWRTGDVDGAAALAELLLPFEDHFAGIACVGLGPVRLALAFCAMTTGRFADAEADLDAAAAVALAQGWHAVTLEVTLRRATLLVARGGPDDELAARALLEEAEARGRELGLGGLVAEAVALRANIDGVPLVQMAAPTRRRAGRYRARLITGGRAAVAWWTRNDDDEDLLRRFGSARAQRALFTAMTKAFQPELAHGFRGDIEVELRVPDDGLEPIEPDWWTLEIGPTAAQARPGRRPGAALTVHTTLPDFIRLASGELTMAGALVSNRVRLEGDVILAARVPIMFGAVAPLI